MGIRIATYNVNNLFERPAVMRLGGFSAQSAKVLTDIQRLNTLLESDSYAGAVGQEMVTLLTKYNFHKKSKNPWFDINEVREKLFSVSKGKIKLKAAGRADWLGWVELVYENLKEANTENTGRVIREVQAEVLCVVEVEDRITLERFNNGVLKQLNARYAHNLLIDGNDDRGIDVGLLSQHEIRSVRSHIDDKFTAANGKKFPIFSRDCPEYEVVLPGGGTLWMLCNHLKSKGFGNQADNDAKRKRQADRVQQILGRFNLDTDFVVVAGDFNDSPASAPLAGLLSTPKLHDVLSSNKLQGPRWTYHTGNQQIDYLLVSSALFNKLDKVGIERRGIYSKTNFGGQFTHFAEVTSKTTQASDHAAVWAEFNL